MAISTTDEKIAGVILVRVREESVFWPFLTSSKTTIGYIMTICVSSAFRRKGVASSLLEHLRVHFKKQFESFKLELHVLQENTAAINLYKNHCFQNRRSISDYYFFHGDFHDAYHFVLDASGTSEKEDTNDSKTSSLGESTRTIAFTSYRRLENTMMYVQDMFASCIRR